MDSLSFSLEGRGSTETLEEDKELSLAQLEEIDTKTEAVAGKIKDQEYIKEIKELHAYLDTVKTMVRPGCSPENKNLSACLGMCGQELRKV
ncbi:hypothetical protein OIU76_010622 [Salix suchowensis]|nr:hypothetical protein OIU76_010622 [Salix suchowensis]